MTTDPTRPEGASGATFSGEIECSHCDEPKGGQADVTVVRTELGQYIGWDCQNCGARNLSNGLYVFPGGGGGEL